jgi:hypothetical protein
LVHPTSPKSEDLEFLASPPIVKYNDKLPARLSIMVYYFTSNTVTPSAFIYVGKDKVESNTLPLSHLNPP